MPTSSGSTRAIRSRGPRPSIAAGRRPSPTPSSGSGPTPGAPDVLAELAKKYAELKRPDDEIRCLKAYLRLSPTSGRSRRSPPATWPGGDRDAWKATLDQALSKPDNNLDAVDYQIRIARQLMKEGRWAEAHPYAEAVRRGRGRTAGWRSPSSATRASRTGAGAERWLRRLVERYPGNSWDEWLLWCARTGHGDLAEAEGFAALVVARLGNPPGNAELPGVAGFLAWTGKDREAIEANLRLLDGQGKPAGGMMAAALADRLKDAGLRDATLLRISNPKITRSPGKAAPTQTQMAPANLAGQFNAWLAGADPDFAAIDATIALLPAAQRGGMDYVVASLMANHDRSDDATRYLLKAARNRQADPWSRVLAIRELRSKKVPLTAADIAPPGSP